MFTFKLIPYRDYSEIILSGMLLSSYEGTPLLEEIRKEEKYGSNLILDLKDLKHINSEGFNVMLHILTRTRNADGDAVIINLSEELKQLFIITKLNNVFTIAESKDAAIAKLAEGKTS